MSDNPTNIRSILVANRGEIAVRIFKTAKQMGLRTIGVYSQADAKARHVSVADEAVFIGPANATKSYLSIEKIIQAAIDSGADAIHPGYGFLSENADFALACKKAGLIFIGPSPEAIEMMGDKARAKTQAELSEVACIPGYQGAAQDEKHFLNAADRVGYPIMIKAAAGGGGRGIRLVERSQDLVLALKDASAEALSGFGSGALILEKTIANARHIEIQILGDKKGNVIHLGERDCSLQRNHQKIIEEAPSPSLTPDLRKRMGESAIKIAKSVKYEGAGTVEFLLDKTDEYYFLEMNTRLQVEHGVSELVTGIDLVEMQIRIADGEVLPITQNDVEFCGHAIEARLYTEDPGLDFQPATGEVTRWVPPDIGHIRVDTALQTGDIISPFYDGMVAKIISYGKNRKTAHKQLVKALEQMVLYGPKNNKSYLLELLNTDDFAAGEVTTGFIASSNALRQMPYPVAIEKMAIYSALIELILRCENAWSMALNSPRELLGWSSSPLPALSYKLGYKNEVIEFSVRMLPGGKFEVKYGGSYHIYKTKRDNGGIFIENTVIGADSFMRQDAEIYCGFDGWDIIFKDLTIAQHSTDSIQSDGKIVAPIHGVLVELGVRISDHVLPGDKIGVMEAMKMHHEVNSPVSGTVRTVHFKAGSQVDAGQILIEIDEKSDAAGK